MLIGPDGQRQRLEVKLRVTSNNQFSIRQLAVMGLGLSFHVEPEIAEDLAAGRLVRVLPEWSSSTLSVDALMPARAHQPAKVRMALHALRTYLDRLARTAEGCRRARRGRTR